MESWVLKGNAVSETCQYAGNSFCAALKQHQREALCADCRIRSYAANQLHELAYWKRGPALLVEGFIVLGGTEDDPEAQGFRAREYVHAGEFVCFGNIFGTDEAYPFVDRGLCLTDCSLALLDYNVFQLLLNTDLNFCRKIATVCCTGWGVAEQHLDCDTAYKKVRFFLDYCHQNGLPHFTHEQIAVACNLSRQTVTKLMGELTKSEPGLFTRPVSDSARTPKP